MSGVTFTIRHHSPASERYTLACKHGTTFIDAVTGTAEDMDTAATIIRDVHQRKYPRCHEDVTLFRDVWPDIEMAKAQWAGDTDRVVPGGDYDRPEIRDGHATTLASLMAMGCPDCKPGVQTEASLGVDRLTLVHERDCPTKRLQTVDLR